MSYYSRAIGYIQLHHTLPVHKTKRKVCACIHVHAYLIGLYVHSDAVEGGHKR